MTTVEFESFASDAQGVPDSPINDETAKQLGDEVEDTLKGDYRDDNEKEKSSSNSSNDSESAMLADLDKKHGATITPEESRAINKSARAIKKMGIAIDNKQLLKIIDTFKKNGMSFN